MKSGPPYTRPATVRVGADVPQCRVKSLDKGLPRRLTGVEHHVQLRTLVRLELSRNLQDARVPPDDSPLVLPDVTQPDLIWSAFRVVPSSVQLEGRVDHVAEPAESLSQRAAGQVLVKVELRRRGPGRRERRL